MVTWAIGDVHGQRAALERLFSRLDFDFERDDLWLVGDLVNRGPDSLGVLRWARQMHERLGTRFVAVLGNHDLRLLACGAGIAKPRPRDTVDDVLGAPDAGELLAWLRRRPLCHRAAGDLLVHAGLLPGWSVAEAEKRAREAETALVADDELLADWHLRRTPKNSGRRRRRRTLEVLTGIRTCATDDKLCDWSGAPAGAPKGCRPWFSWARSKKARRRAATRVIFGHWAALGLHLASGVCGLDSGAAWGGRLTALRLGDEKVVQEEVGEG